MPQCASDWVVTRSIATLTVWLPPFPIAMERPSSHRLFLVVLTLIIDLHSNSHLLASLFYPFHHAMPFLTPHVSSSSSSSSPHSSSSSSSLLISFCSHSRPSCLTCIYSGFAPFYWGFFSRIFGFLLVGFCAVCVWQVLWCYSLEYVGYVEYVCLLLVLFPWVSWVWGYSLEYVEYACKVFPRVCWLCMSYSHVGWVCQL